MNNALTVREVSEMLGVGQHGILALIRTGELLAVDVSLHPGGRPRWRIMLDEIEGFLIRRTHLPPGPRRRRRKTATVKKYF